jgi:hypothetical protein
MNRAKHIGKLASPPLYRISTVFLVLVFKAVINVLHIFSYYTQFVISVLVQCTCCAICYKLKLGICSNVLLSIIILVLTKNLPLNDINLLS